MKKIFLALFLVTMSKVLSTIHMDPMSPIKLPSQQELCQHLNDAGFNDFVKETHFDKEFGDKEIRLFEFVLLINFIDLRQPKRLTHKERLEITTIVLKEYPQALEFLKEHNLYVTKEYQNKQ
ncbi:MAG TPA: hypothetical protein VLB80_04155 [Candidatus Babeliales bacterium]|nr:hypothetical protein [Candidatus Babeliales bacterium]